MFDLSPFDTTLFLDADTVPLGDLSFIFDRAEKYSLACSICECPWARRYGGIDGDTVEYNTGVIGFTRKSAPVFMEWKANAAVIDSSILFRTADGVGRMAHNDQAGFAMACETTGIHPFALPMNWNFRPSWHRSVFGPIKIWHDYREVPKSLLDWNERQIAPGAMIEYAKIGD